IEPEQDNIFGITVTLRDNAEYNDRILLFDQSKILLSGTSKITSFVTAIRVISNKFFKPGNDKPPQPRKPSSISLSGSSAIKADIGIDLSGDAPSTISLSDSSKIQATTAAIKVSGEGDRITLSDQAALSSNFQGIIISGVDSTKNTVELGGKTS